MSLIVKPSSEAPCNRFWDLSGDNDIKLPYFPVIPLLFIGKRRHADADNNFARLHDELCSFTRTCAHPCRSSCLAAVTAALTGANNKIKGSSRLLKADPDAAAGEATM